MNNVTQPKSLVLVVGAGASKEVNLPVGAELRMRIAHALNIKYGYDHRRSSGDAAIDAAFRILADDINPFLHSSWRIRDAMPQAISIDNFIDSHRDDDQIAICGKLAIARCILAAEAESKLFVNRENVNPQIRFTDFEGTWFDAFFKLLTENCQKSELDQRFSQVAIVSFNYDRCIAHYLHCALQNYYGIDSTRAAQVMNNLKIYHPYGSVGQLPWQNQTEGIDFGFCPDGLQLVKISKDIKTFTEGIDHAQSDINKIREILRQAQRIAFLGFAFHRLNLSLLFPGLKDKQRILPRPTYATCLGVSRDDQREIINELHSLGAIYSDRVYFKEVTCAQLFNENRRGLSFNL
jgi:hypothetical protein